MKSTKEKNTGRKAGEKCLWWKTENKTLGKVNANQTEKKESMCNYTFSY